MLSALSLFTTLIYERGRCFLLDEPAASWDPIHHSRFKLLLRQVMSQHPHMSCLIVTHAGTLIDWAEDSSRIWTVNNDKGPSECKLLQFTQAQSALLKYQMYRNALFARQIVWLEGPSDWTFLTMYQQTVLNWTAQPQSSMPDSIANNAELKTRVQQHAAVLRNLSFHLATGKNNFADVVVFKPIVPSLILGDAHLLDDIGRKSSAEAKTSLLKRCEEFVSNQKEFFCPLMKKLRVSASAAVLQAIRDKCTGGHDSAVLQAAIIQAGHRDVALQHGIFTWRTEAGEPWKGGWLESALGLGGKDLSMAEMNTRIQQITSYQLAHPNPKQQRIVNNLNEFIEFCAKWFARSDSTAVKA